MIKYYEGNYWLVLFNVMHQIQQINSNPVKAVVTINEETFVHSGNNFRNACDNLLDTVLEHYNIILV